MMEAGREASREAANETRPELEQIVSCVLRIISETTVTTARQIQEGRNRTRDA